MKNKKVYIYIINIIIYVYIYIFTLGQHGWENLQKTLATGSKTMGPRRNMNIGKG